MLDSFVVIIGIFCIHIVSFCMFAKCVCLVSTTCIVYQISTRTCCNKLVTLTYVLCLFSSNQIK